MATPSDADRELATRMIRERVTGASDAEVARLINDLAARLAAEAARPRGVTVQGSVALPAPTLAASVATDPFAMAAHEAAREASRRAQGGRTRGAQQTREAAKTCERILVEAEAYRAVTAHDRLLSPTYRMAREIVERLASADRDPITVAQSTVQEYLAANWDDEQARRK